MSIRLSPSQLDEILALQHKLARGDSVWTLFHFGFAVDEQLADRLAYHRQHENEPAKVLGPHFLVGETWSPAKFEALLASFGQPKSEITSAGREIQV